MDGNLEHPFLAPAVTMESPRVEPLWPRGAPGAVGSEEQDRPSLIHYPAAQPNGTGVLICPGGGYGMLAIDHEGHQVASWFNRLGVSAFILQYRLGPRYRFPAPFEDARRAMRIIRSGARLGLHPKRVGVLGFSAGGHLASLLSTRFHRGERPDFAVLAYPVISFAPPYRHEGCVRNLLGESPDPALVARMCTATSVTSRTPPTFLFHADGDTSVPPDNSVLYYQALRAARVPAELHIYSGGRHGIGLARDEPVHGSWPERLKDWLDVLGLLTSPYCPPRTGNELV